VKEYYDTRAPEYDDWHLGVGRFASRERPGWRDAVIALEQAVQALEPTQRILNDGSAFEVYKRYFDGDELARELGDGAVLHASDWFVMVASPSPG
jgi:hypothetical protein